MNINKLSSSEVPEKFSEWLLSMGCPSERVPNSDMIAQMCRGQYYMVWKSLIENVVQKDDIKYKRLLVFCDDIQNYRNKTDGCALIPDELGLWKQHDDLKQKLCNAEEQVNNCRKDIHQLMDKISSKVLQRNLARTHMTDAQRRLYLLQQVSEDLQNKKSNLQETMSIANSLCCIENEDDAESKLDKCVTLLRRSAGRGASVASTTPLSNVNSTSCSSTMSTNSDHDTEEQLLSLVKCGGDKLWPLLCGRRAGLLAALTRDHVRQDKKHDRVTPQSVLAHTSALHCSIALKATKNKLHIAQTRKRLAAAIATLDMYPMGEACEYLVVCCEQIRAQARVNALKSLLDELGHRRGIFEGDGRHVVERHAARRMISNMDKAILNKKDELKRVLSTLGMTERKIENVKECLKTVFKSFQDQEKLNDVARYVNQISLPQESIHILRQFYEEKRERNKNKVNLSLDWDVSDHSLTNVTADDGPKFINELKMYLNDFCLENNKKLVLESGEKIWIFETLQSSLDRLYSKWLREDVMSSILCPTMNLHSNINNIIQDINKKEESSYVLNEMQGRMKKFDLNIDITKISEEENIATDKIKKRLNDNLLNLKDMSRTLDVVFKNLELWSKNEFRKYIRTQRCVDGKSYRDCEKYYLDCINV